MVCHSGIALTVTTAFLQPIVMTGSQKTDVEEDTSQGYKCLWQSQDESQLESEVRVKVKVLRVENQGVQGEPHQVPCLGDSRPGTEDAVEWH